MSTISFRGFAGVPVSRRGWDVHAAHSIRVAVLPGRFLESRGERRGVFTGQVDSAGQRGGIGGALHALLIGPPPGHIGEQGGTAQEHH